MKNKQWTLTTKHSASSYGMPVAVNVQTGEIFGPGDIVKPYPFWGYMLGSQAVQRMAELGIIECDAAAVDRFCAQAPG